MNRLVAVVLIYTYGNFETNLSSGFRVISTHSSGIGPIALIATILIFFRVFPVIGGNRKPLFPRDVRYAELKSEDRLSVSVIVPEKKCVPDGRTDRQTDGQNENKSSPH